MSPYSQVALTTDLTLVAAVLVISNAEVYQLADGFSYANPPYVTFTARTITQCSLRCAAVTTGDCDGFQFLPDGACLLYLEEEPPVCSEGPVEPTTTTEQTALTVSVSVQPATYRKLRNNTGDSTDACVFTDTSTDACPNGFQRCANRCYLAELTEHNYTAAEQYCSSMAAVLATPRTAPENACAWNVTAAAAGSIGMFWMGYRGGTTADSFVGADGGAMSFTNWNTAGGEPNLSVADNCARLYSKNGLWYDFPCRYGQYVLCQAQN